MKKNSAKIAVLVLLGTISAFACSAQKLPGMQEKSVLLPATTNIDGLATEWNNNFQAFNKSTDVYYTLANNKQNLYLAVQATDPEIIKKIMRGGIRLTVCPSGQRNDADAVTITFPVMPVDYQRGITLMLNNLTEAQKNKGNVDSASNVLNRLIASGEKQIKVKGFKAINDSLISVHSNWGLAAAGLIDVKGVFTCELMLPLELADPAARKEIAYNITLSGEPAVVRKANVSVTVKRTSGSTADSDMSLMYPTDFWGKYKLTN